MPSYFRREGASTGKSLIGPIIVGEPVHFVCAPEEIGLYLLVLQGASDEFNVIGAFEQKRPMEPWVVQPTNVAAPQAEEGLVPFRFNQPGYVTVTIMQVTREVMNEVMQLSFFARCTAVDMARWCGGSAMNSSMVTCQIQSNQVV